MKALGRLSDFLNKHIISLQKGNIVIVKGTILTAKYSLSTDSDVCVGLLLSNGFTIDEDKNIFYSKMYKVFILGSIINIRQSDIQEKI